MFFKISFLFYFNSVFSQVTIKVVNELNKPIEGTVVSYYIKDILVTNGITEANGEFTKHLKLDIYTVKIQSLTHKDLIINLNLNKSDHKYEVYLKDEIFELKEVAIKGITKLQKKIKSIDSPEIIDFKSNKASSKSIIDLINSTNGVRISQDGGMGSTSNISLNGINGKDVKIFIDGIPLALLGNGFNLQNLSLAMVDYIEVYKGVVPINFGSDNLGGVINIVTNYTHKDKANISYSFGSWNSHEASLSLLKYPLKNKKVYFGIDVGYRHSDNDYLMHDVDIVFDDNLNTKKGEAKRFNDKYDATLVKTQLGFRKLKWFDEIQLKNTYTGVHKEWQHGVTTEKPWGETFSKEFSYGSLINLSKKSKGDQKWQARLTLGYNYEHVYFEDIATKDYFWDGSFIKKNLKGETGFYAEGRTPKIHQNVFYSRTNLAYEISNKQKLGINFLASNRVVKGEDKAGTFTHKKDPFKTPQYLTNYFAGLSYSTRFFENVIQSKTSLKYYNSDVKGIIFKIDNSVIDVEKSISNTGFGQIFKIRALPSLLLMPSYEYAIRQPDSRELFGDFITTKPNPKLQSSTGHNFNFKIQYKPSNKITTGVNPFYRNTSNRIILTALSPFVSMHTNLLNTATIGSEFFINYDVNKKLSLNYNATYLDTRLTGVDKFGAFTESYVGLKVPNIPYFYMNLRLSYLHNFKSNQDYSLKFLLTTSYVHQFYHTWEANGIASSKAVIPYQFSNDISVALQSNKNWSIALDFKNITNAKLYDNFSVQKPGFGGYIKLIYSLNNLK